MFISWSPAVPEPSYDCIGGDAVVHSGPVPGTFFSDADIESVSMCREEFAEGCDTEALLRRYGGAVFAGPWEPGEVDFDMDLQAAHEALRRAERTFDALPDSVRGKHASWRDLLVEMSTPAGDPTGKPAESPAPEGSPPATP